MRFTPDVEALFVQLLAKALPEAEVRGEADVDAVDILPLIIVHAADGRMVSNGQFAWEWRIGLTFLAADRGVCSDLADSAYVAMHQFHDEQASIPGEGYVSSVEDDSMPTRTATSLTPAGDLTQYNGSWTAIIRKS